MKKIKGISFILILFFFFAAGADAGTYARMKGIIHSGSDLDTGYGVGMALGFNFDAIRFEGELEFRDTEIEGTNIGIQMWDLLANVYVDFFNASMLTPYIGIGGGYGWFDIDQGFDYDDTQFVYQGTVGVNWDVTHNVKMDAQYRYLTDGDEFKTNNFCLGLRFDF